MTTPDGSTATPKAVSPLAVGARERRDEGAWTVAAAPLASRETRAGPLEIVDACARARTGFKGAGVLAWLSGLEFPLPESVNLARHTAGLVIARLGKEEFLVVSREKAADRTVRRLEARFADARAGLPATCLVVPRESASACLAMTGAGVPELLARVTSIDVSNEAFPDGAVRQTLVAGVAATLIRDGDTLLVVVDRTLAAWFGETLTDVAAALPGA